jgi:hypothetical protein
MLAPARPRAHRWILLCDLAQVLLLPKGLHIPRVTVVSHSACSALASTLAPTLHPARRLGCHRDTDASLAQFIRERALNLDF